MRLICPSCDAEYAVDDAAIPETGRDVQCSNCGHAWFQLPAAVLAQPEAGLDLPEDQVTWPDTADAADEAPAPTPRRAIDEGLLAILREEAEREAAARRAEAGVIEVQTEMGLVAPAATAAETGGMAEVAAQRAAEDEPRPPPPPLRVPSRRALLPDIEEINSSLKAKEGAPRPGADAAARLAAQRSAFRSGFLLVLLIVALGLSAYVTAPKLAVQIPGAAPALERYVASVDLARLRLDDGMRRATQALRELTAQIANSTGG